MPTIIDTVVAHYFLLVDRFDLLVELLDNEAVMSRVVYDPDDHGVENDDAVSELTKGVRYQNRLAQAPDTQPQQREEARANAERIARIRDHIKSDAVSITDMSDTELNLFSRLTAQTPDADLGLMLPLGAGEAACLAIAVERDYIVATDDTDALRALERLDPGHPYERIRKLLIRAGQEQKLTKREANVVHAKMRQLGFWDRTAPFPDA